MCRTGAFLFTTFAVLFASCSVDGSIESLRKKAGESGEPIAVAFNNVTANGSMEQTTTALTLTFSKVITGLTSGNITLNGIDGINKGVLTGSGPAYTLPVSGFTEGGTLSVAVTKTGYTISGSTRNVTIHYYTPPIAVTLNSVTANGSADQTTTVLTLTFSQAIAGLGADDITLSGVEGIIKGTLVGTGPEYTLPISGFTAGGTLNVSVSKAGYDISGLSRNVTIYYDTPPIAVTLNSVTANGSADQTTTVLTLTFSQAIAGLGADDITLSGVDGIIKGTLVGTGPTYTLPVSGFREGGTLSVAVLKPGYNVGGSPQTVTIFNSDPPVAVTFIDLTANGSPTEATTQLTLTFSGEIAGLTIADITLSGVTNVQKRTLDGANPYTLTINGFATDGKLSVAVARAGYTIIDSPRTVNIYPWPAPSNAIPLTADQWGGGNITSETGEEWYSFPVTAGTQYSVWWNDEDQGIGTATGDVVVGAWYADGTLIFGGTNTTVDQGWDTPQTFTANSNIPVYIRVTAYNNSQGTYDIVYSTNIIRPPIIAVNFSSITADGSPIINTTTMLTLIFSEAIINLSADDITLSGIAGINWGPLDGTGPTYTLPISGFNVSGDVTVVVRKDGYTTSIQTVEVFYRTIHLLWIPAGTFTMGSPTTEPSRGSSETQHSVTLTQGFYMGRYQVTQGQYQAVMGASEDRTTTTSGKGDNYPIYYVNWYDALVFCNKLSIMDGLTPAYRISGSTNPSDWGEIPTSSNTAWDSVQIVVGSTGYRLPTEAQWEYACRAGRTTAFNWGTNQITMSQANFDGRTYPYNGSSTTGTYLGRTTTVGSYTPNAWGLYDMHGNVREWCWDWYGSYASGAQTDPVGASSGTYRVSRGGHWLSYGQYLRSAYRSSNSPGGRNSNVGFRLVRP